MKRKYLLKNSTRILAVFVSTLLVLVVLATTVVADMGPKPCATVSVINAPSEDYYIALLSEDDSIHRDYVPDDSLSNAENEIVSKMYDYEEDGYTLFQNIEPYAVIANITSVLLEFPFCLILMMIKPVTRGPLW